MNKFYPELNLRILEMAEGDEDFRIELTDAIHKGLLELETKYMEGFLEKDELKIQQIRHKVKPTLAMFEFEYLAVSIHEGKLLLESEGFGESFEAHFQQFMEAVKGAIEEVSALNQ
jgi:hypothetical protein